MPASKALHALIDRLSARDRASVQSFAEYLELRAQHPAVRAAVLAPLDDEPESSEEAAAVAEALEDLRLGRVIRDDELVV